MATRESYTIAQHRYKVTNVETAEPVGTPVLDTPFSSSTNEIPNWCKNLFEEKQENPDKDPGFEVIIKMWSRDGSILIEHAFMHIGQDDEKIEGQCVGSGKIDTGTAHWKNKSIAVPTHDISHNIVMPGDHYDINIHQLRTLT